MNHIKKQTKETPALNKDYILVNKYLYLTNNYVPENLENIPTSYARSGMKLVKTAKDKFVEMAEAASKDGYKVIAMSSYRSYDYQVDLYNNYVKSDGVLVYVQMFMMETYHIPVLNKVLHLIG